MAPHAVRPASLAWPGARSRLSLRPPARKRKRKKKRQKEEHRRQNTEKTEHREDRRQKTEERTQRRKTTEDRRQQRFVFSQMSSSYWGCMRHDAFFCRDRLRPGDSSRGEKRRARVFFSFLFFSFLFASRTESIVVAPGQQLCTISDGGITAESNCCPGGGGDDSQICEKTGPLFRGTAFPRFVPSLSWQIFRGFSRIKWRAKNNTVVFLPGPYTPAAGPSPRDRGCSKHRCRWLFSSRRALPPPLG